MDEEILKIDVAQRAMVSAHKDAIGIGARKVERVDLPMLLIEETQYLAVLGRGNNSRARALTVSSQANWVVRRARALRRKAAVADCAAHERDAIPGNKGMALRRRQVVPRVGEGTVARIAGRAIQIPVRPSRLPARPTTSKQQRCNQHKESELLPSLVQANQSQLQKLDYPISP